MRLAFMGTPQFAVPTLQKLIDSNYEVSVVVTGPDRKAGRQQRLCTTPVKELALAANIPILQPVNLNDPTFAEELAQFEPDIAVVVAFRILPVSVLAIPKRGCINLHPSLLPDLRGAAPINWALIRGYEKTGISTFLLEKKVDAGGILMQVPVDIDPEDNFGTLSDRLCKKGANVILDSLDGYFNGSIKPKTQTGEVTKAPKITQEICCLNWQSTATDIHNLVRGLTPQPGVFTNLGRKRVKIHKTKVIDSQKVCDPGSVQFCEKDYIAVGTGEGILAVYQLQLEGKRSMNASEFLKGRPIEPGTVFGN